MKDFEDRADFSSPSVISPTQLLRVDVEKTPSPTTPGVSAGFRLGGVLGWNRAALSPMYGIHFGFLLGAQGHLFVFDLENFRQANSSADAWARSGYATGLWKSSVIYFAPSLFEDHLNVRAEFSSLASNNATLSDAESIDASVARKDSTRWTLVLTSKLNPATRVEAGLDVFQVGAAALVSKNFALGIPSSQLLRWHAGLSRDLNAGLSLGVNIFAVTGVDDDLALATAAPFFDENYVLSKMWLGGRLTWNF